MGIDTLNNHNEQNNDQAEEWTKVLSDVEYQPKHLKEELEDKLATDDFDIWSQDTITPQINKMPHKASKGDRSLSSYFETQLRENGKQYGRTPEARDRLKTIDEVRVEMKDILESDHKFTTEKMPLDTAIDILSYLAANTRNHTIDYDENTPKEKIKNAEALTYVLSQELPEAIVNNFVPEDGYANYDRYGSFPELLRALKQTNEQMAVNYKDDINKANNFQRIANCYQYLDNTLKAEETRREEASYI